MVDPIDEPGPNEPPPGPPEGEFSPDFFEDMAAEEPDPEAGPLPAPVPGPAPVTPAPAAPKRPAFESPSLPTVPPDDPARARPIFPMVLGVILLGVFVAAWISQFQAVKAPAGAASSGGPATPELTAWLNPSSSAAAPEGASASGPAPSAGGTTRPAPAPVLADEVKSLKAEVEGLVAQVKGLQERIEKHPKPEPAPDLAPLQSRIEALARTTATVEPLPGKLSDLDKRIDGLDQSLKGLRDEVHATKGEIIKKLGTLPASATPRPESTTPEPADVNVAGEGMEDGVKLFEARKYKEAADLFRKLTGEFPKDARVWYYAALSNGLATSQWAGETDRLANQGVEREKAGSPDGPKIDAVFTGLPPSLKPWLDAYRKRAAR